MFSTNEIYHVRSFGAPGPKAKMHYCALSIVRPSVVNFFDFFSATAKQKFNETLQEIRSERPLPSL